VSHEHLAARRSILKLNRPKPQTPAESPTPSSTDLGRQKIVDAQNLLAARFPVFHRWAAPGPWQPLAIGIREHIFARAPDLDQKLVRKALAHYCNTIQYLQSLIAPGAQRHDLEGKPVAPVTADEAAHARDKRSAIRTRRSER
jgi:sRNA-binding protein